MAMSATITSTGGTATIPLNPVAKSTIVQLTATSCSSGTVTVQFSLDDVSLYGGPTATWSLLSSVASMTSSLISTANLSWTILSPIGAVRMTSTQWDNSTASTLTLKALQSVTA